MHQPSGLQDQYLKKLFCFQIKNQCALIVELEQNIIIKEINIDFNTWSYPTVNILENKHFSPFFSSLHSHISLVVV